MEIIKQHPLYEECKKGGAFFTQSQITAMVSTGICSSKLTGGMVSIPEVSVINVERYNKTHLPIMEITINGSCSNGYVAKLLRDRARQFYLLIFGQDSVMVNFVEQTFTDGMSTTFPIMKGKTVAERLYISVDGRVRVKIVR